MKHIKLDAYFSLAVCRLYIITTNTNLIPGASFSIGKQHEG